jgi:hypothetical protein
MNFGTAPAARGELPLLSTLLGWRGRLCAATALTYSHMPLLLLLLLLLRLLS